jgi:hypothetical protein
VKLHEVPAPGAVHASVVVSSETYYTIGLSGYGYRAVIFSAIKLSEYRISYWRTHETIGLSDIGSRPQSIGLSDIGIRKNYRLATSKRSPGSPPPLDSAASLRPVPLVTRVTQDINRGRKFCQLLPTKGEKKQRHL